MKQLRRVALVQFYLHEAFDIEMDGSTAFLGPNGSGKSSTLDAIQIAMLGGNQQYARFNTQSVSSKQRRSLSGYCLGMLRNPEKDSQVIGRARDEARTYIILVFGDMDSGADVLSAGICIEADVESEQHEVKGLFVLPGQNLRANDCIVYDGNDRFPMPFAEFRDAAREQAKKIGRTAIFTDKSGEYVQELLYALNGQRMPDSRRFMSSFVKSMTLKNVDSIDDFVRNYVVEPNPVDIAAFRKQVEQFEALRDLIKRTKARISRLTGILSDFERARSAERRIASLEAIKAVFQVEWLGEQIDELDERIETLSNQRQVAQDKAQQAKKDRDTQQEKVNKLTVQLESDQAEQSRLRLEGEIRANQQLIEAYQHPELARANRLINALRDVLDDDAFKSTKGLVVSAIDSLVQARSEDGSGSVVVKALSELDTQIAPVRAIAKNQLSAVIKQGDALTEESEATRRRIAAAGRTGRLLNDGAALLLELLERAGMAVQPVSALARISRPEWAPALEAYLGGDRDAMVVIEGHSQEAVKILREARRRGQKVDGAAVIQPNHLRQVNTAPKGAEFAVGLLETSNDTARRFLWQKFGNIRLVDTEEELETHSRAITRDGMLSQGGLTKSIRVAPVSDLRVGKDIEDTSHLSRHLADIQGQLEVLTKRQTRLETLVRALSSQDSFDDEGIAEKLAEAEKTIAVAKQQLATLDISHLGEIRTLLKQSQASYQQLDEEYTKNDRLAVGLNQQIEDRVCDKTALLDQLPEYRETEQSALKNSLIVVEMMDSLKDEIERSESAYRARIAEVEKKLTNNQSRLKTAEERGSLDLVSYVQDERLDVQVSDMHWHDRFFWASEEKHKLADTQLQNYEAEAEQARLASEETLRSDIAMSLHDRFKEMDLERRERNKILDACPAFTGGERYRFTSSVVPHYESLVRYINQIAQDEQSLSLFDDNADDINETLRELVEAAAESGNASAVLDYRQFFTFDLDILVDGKRVDRMSNRQGAGSNGEHIAPMYVAAGAALAKAYRLHNRNSLLIITVSFVPVFTLEAQEGRMFSPLAFTKTYAMAASAALAITLVPVLMGYFIRGKVLPEHKNPLNRALIAVYMPVLKTVLQYPKSTLVLALIITVVGFWPVNKIGSEFIPPLDEGDLMYMPTTYPGLSIGKAREILQQTDKLIATVPEVKSVFGKIGRAETATDPAPLTMIETFIQIKPRDEWREGMTTDKLKKELDALVKFPGLTNAWVMPIKTRIDMLATGIKTPVGIKVAGPDLKEIEKIGKRLEQVLNDVPGTASVYSERVAGGRYIKVDIQREKAARYGLNIADVQQVVATAIGGMNVTQTIEGLERYPVNLRYPQDLRNSPEQLALLPIVTGTGQRIALADVANVYVEDGPPAIKSENARLNGWTFVDIDGVDIGSYVKEAMVVVADQVDLPAGYSLNWSGQYEYMLRAKAKLTYVVPLTLAIIIVLLYFNFRSFAEVAIIMGTLPLAMVGSIWLMYLLGYNFSVAVGVGFIALAGVAVEIGVIMLVYLNQAYHHMVEECEKKGVEPRLNTLRHAVLHGAGLRVRPVMMTAAAIIAGLLPIMYGTGTGSEVMSRIAAPMVGGMIGAVILTLLVLPATYLLWKRSKVNVS